MAGSDETTRAWPRGEGVQDAARVKQKALGLATAGDIANRKKIAALKAQRLERDAAEASRKAAAQTPT